MKSGRRLLDGGETTVARFVVEGNRASCRENGGLHAKPSGLLSATDREMLNTHKGDVLQLLAGEASFLQSRTIDRIRRLASRIGTTVQYDGKSGLLVGVFRDKAVVDTGNVVLSLNHTDISCN